MPGAHALLSASGSERWLMCPPSARQEEKYPETESNAAKEGTLAHNIGELLIRNKLGRVSDKALADCLANLTQDPLYFPEMMDFCEEYAQFCIDEYNAIKLHTHDAIAEVEVQLDLSEYVPEGFGTGDFIIIADRVLRIIDLKFGKGKYVECKHNKQMCLYGLGALEAYAGLFDIRRVEMTIYQPRLNNISTWGIDVPELKNWGSEYLKPIAQQAFVGEGEFLPGPHCGFCKHKNRCKTLADENLKLAAYKFAVPEELTDEDIADILDRTDMFTNWINSINAYAQKEAIENGKQWPGYKLVEGRSNRQYTDKDTIAAVLITEGFEEEAIYKPRDLKGLTDLEKAIGKTPFKTLLSGYIVKPPGKPALVSESDPRPPMNTAEKAAEKFAEALNLDE